MRLIDADATKINLDELHVTSDPKINAMNRLIALCVEHTLRDAPTVKAEIVKHGHWIFKNGLASELVCSGCFEQFHIATWQRSKFLRCPSCGARMDEAEE